MGVLDEIKAISAQLGLGFGLSLATNDSKVQLSQVYSFSHRWLNRQMQLVDSL